MPSKYFSDVRGRTKSHSHETPGPGEVIMNIMMVDHDGLSLDDSFHSLNPRAKYKIIITI